MSAVWQPGWSPRIWKRRSHWVQENGLTACGMRAAHLVSKHPPPASRCFRCVRVLAARNEATP